VQGFSRSEPGAELRHEQMHYNGVTPSTRSSPADSKVCFGQKRTFLQLGTVLVGGGAVQKWGQVTQAGQQVADLTLQGANLSVGVVHAGLDPVVQIGVRHAAEVGLAINLVVLSSTDHLAGDDDADLTDAGDIGVEQTTLNLLSSQGSRERLARGVDHAVGDTDGLGQNAAQTDTREDIHVVTLAGVVGAGLALGVGEGESREGRTRGEEATTVSVLDGGLIVTLRLGGRVGEGEDDGSSVPVSHLGEDLGSEDTTQSRQTHQDSGLDVVNNLLQSLPLLASIVLTSKVNLVVSELVTTVSSDETLGINKVEAAAGLILGHTLTHEELDDLLGNTDTGRAGTEEDSAVVLAWQTRSLNSIDDTTEDNGAGTLDIVIEASVGIAVTLQSGERILEVLELDNNSRISFVLAEIVRVD